MMGDPNRRSAPPITGSSAAWRSMCGAAEAKTAHPEKTRRERHLRSSRTFQRDRLSPSDADSSVSHCSEHTVASKNAANHPNVSTRIRSRGEVMWVIRPRSRTPNTRTSLRSVAGDPSARCRSGALCGMRDMAPDLVIGAHLRRRAPLAAWSRPSGPGSRMKDRSNNCHADQRTCHDQHERPVAHRHPQSFQAIVLAAHESASDHQKSSGHQHR